MCARVAYLILGAFFIFIVSTVAAFVYLPWWQAILVSLAVFTLIIVIGRLLIGRFFNSFARMAQEAMSNQSKVLRGAEVDIHKIQQTTMPASLRKEMQQAIADAEDADEDPPEFPDYEALHWFELELTIVPDSKLEPEDNTWEPETLKFVPFDAKSIDFNMADDEDDEDEKQPDQFDIYEMKQIVDGAATDVEGESFTGMRRLRFTTGVPSGIRLLKFQYYLEQFGRIELPAPGLPPAKRRS
jgi:hypothetical protein